MSWKKYFKIEDFVETERGKFHVFRSEISSSPESPVIFFHHGGGHSALSWSLVARELISNGVEVIAFDARGHGETKSGNDADLALETLSLDLFFLLAKLYGEKPSTKDFIMVGHSMGGPVVVDCVVNHLKSFNILGVVLIDVVEGTAIQSLPYMRQFLRNRPQTFKTIQDAIDWSLQSKTLKVPESAAISIPAQLLKKGDVYGWRTDLLNSEKYWSEWFTKLSFKFLSCKAAKLLIIAGTDRLQDKELMIGQMQGKFQMVILPESGHSVHEDAYAKVSEYILNFWKRNHRLILPPKMTTINKKSPIESINVKIPDHRP